MGGLFGKKPEKPKPIPMPDSQSPEIKQADTLRRRQIAARSGRASTALSSGGQAYSNALLGQ